MYLLVQSASTNQLIWTSQKVCCILVISKSLWHCAYLWHPTDEKQRHLDFDFHWCMKLFAIPLMNCFETIISSQQCGQFASDDLQCDNCRSIASRQFPIRRVTLSSTWLPLAAILLLSVKSPLCWHQTPSNRHFFGKFVNCDQVQVFFDFNDSFWPAHEIYLTAPHHEWHVEQIITQKMSWSN